MPPSHAKHCGAAALPARISLAAERVDAGGVGLDVHGGEEVLEAVVAQVPWGAKSGEELNLRGPRAGRELTETN